MSTPNSIVYSYGYDNEHDMWLTLFSVYVTIECHQVSPIVVYKMSGQTVHCH